MAKQVDSHSEMAQARQTDGLNVIFDQKSPGSSRSRSRSVCSSASSSSADSSYKGRENRRRYRSSSSSSSSSSLSSGSSSSSRSRSRSHPRCHRRSSRCRCDGRGRSPPRSYRDYRSPRRQYRAYSPSYSRSPSPDRYSRNRRYYRSRSRSPRRWDRYRRPESQLRCRFSPSPSRTYRRRSRSRSTGRAVSLSLRDKRALLEAAKVNAMKMFGVEKLDLPESVKPILTDKPDPSRSSPEPVLRAKESVQKLPEENEPEPGVSSPGTSPKGKIAFSENNFVAKPTVVAPSTVKVTPRVDSIGSRKPYGHWIPISSGQSSSPR